MCNERDRLIAYLYDECDARERDAVREHLDTCDECRTEVAGLRSAREDLLAWDVPAHESVWKPFTPAPRRVWWREVPTWAMAAAAGLILIAGLGGGAAVQALASARTQPQRPGAPSVQQDTRVSLTAADLDSLERRLTTRLADQVGAVDAHVQKVSMGSVKTDEFQGDREALLKQIRLLQEQNMSLADTIKTIYANADSVSKAADLKNANLVRKFEDLKTIVLSQLQPPTSGK